MATSDPACPKCGATMEAGFVLDRTYGALTQSEWIEGAPERSFWMGLKVKGRESVPMTTYRCPGCGYLEAYARAD